MKMTTEEAFIKVLQMHGIEHAFGIIGSAMMPISDLFPAAGIKFWDCAHETTAGMIADGYTRATGKMCMSIAQNGPGITNFVTPIKTAYWNHTPMLLVTPQAANSLLKTLEEPPAHVLFIFATTEPSKVIETVRSRCQRFDFKRITEKDIAGKLRRIADAEGAAVDDEVFTELALAAAARAELR